LLIFVQFTGIFPDICSAVSAGIRGGFFKVSMARLNIRIRNYLFSSLACQEIGFFDVTKTGKYCNQLCADMIFCASYVPRPAIFVICMHSSSSQFIFYIL